MGTRSLTFVYDEPYSKRSKPKAIINMYRQFDGYPSGHGQELYDYLKPFTITNGIANGAEIGKSANGAGCLAGQLVCHFKQAVGGVYLYPTTTKDCGQDYEYHVFCKEDGFWVVVKNRGCNMFGLTMSDKNESIFDGDLESFGKFCKEQE